MSLAFGTGGLRGIMGAGPDQINNDVIAHVTHALAQVVLSFDVPKSICITYDTRFNSKEFANVVCDVLSSYGILVYMFDKPVPTPMLSFMIRYKKLGWGVAITASHNPQEYNGYKVYDSFGVQVTDKMAKIIMEAILVYDNITIVTSSPQPLENNVIFLDPAPYFDSIINYIANLQIVDYHTPLKQSSPSAPIPSPTLTPTPYSLTPNPYSHSETSFALGKYFTFSKSHNSLPSTPYPIVYSALYGAGANAVPYVLKELGFNPICIQQEADGSFGGIKTPNPEEQIVYKEAIKTAEEKNAKLILATDPDCDRVGVMIKHQNDFIPMNGNQIGALLIDFLTQTQEVSEDDVVISTIVSGLLGEKVTLEYGMEFIRLLTGFKYIGEYAVQLPENKRFFFGYEESYGFLAGDGARDKDAVIASALIAKMTAFYDNKGITLYDRWLALSEKHGYCLENLQSLNISAKKQEEIMQKLRSAVKINGLTKIEDHINGLDGLPMANVIKLYFENNAWVAIRPSGTEPKLKIYTGVCENTFDKAKIALDLLNKDMLLLLG
ncbi:MAG: phospho-sugar mutase [Oscillospiraceae bacterium]|jgi:phosphoglucomutase|nr:phospho-sugar mutase [Oscillospiraceae bacterium]